VELCEVPVDERGPPATDVSLAYVANDVDARHRLVPVAKRGREQAATVARYCPSGDRNAPRPSREETDLVAEGTPAPDFTLTSDSGESVTLSALRGKPVVLYFYPKDDTPGCTTQACGIRDAYGEFERAGAVVLGVSPDDERSHVKFKEKYGLPFTLLADPDHSVAETYGVWGEKKYAGKTFLGVKRSTFVIGADGNVAKVMHDVKPANHADDVLAALGV
jgi:peroxiredoxin Q/BCP